MWYFAAFIGGLAGGIVLDELFAGSVKAELLLVHNKLDAVLKAIKEKV